MATITPVVTIDPDGSGWVLWEQINDDDTGGAVKLPALFPDKTVAVQGTFTGSPVMVLQGSMDNSTWVTCKSLGGSISAGSDISGTSAYHAVVAGNFRYYRMTRSSGGSAGADVDAYLTFSK